MKANVCAIRLGIAADRIDQALEACTSLAEKTKIAKSYPEFLRAGIKFLTSKDHEVTMNRLTRCNCDFGKTGMKRLHKSSGPRFDGQVQVNTTTLVFDAVAAVSNCLILALTDLTQHKFRSGNANNGEKLWPQGPEDLLPRGPKDSVVALEHWVAAPPHGHIVFKLAGHLATFFVPFAREVFQSPHFSFALARPIKHLEEAVKIYNGGDSSLLARTYFFTYPILTIFGFWEILVQCDTPQFNLMITARGSWISPILAQLITILSPIRDSMWREILVFVRYLAAYAEPEIDPVTGLAMVTLERGQDLPPLDQLESALSVMVDTRKLGCWNITCSSAPDVIHSRLCSKCNLIRFCGEKASFLSFLPFPFTDRRENLQCQKEAWKCATLPHKSVCVKIHSLKEALGADDWSLLWTPDYTYGQFQVTCMVKKVDIHMVKRIGSTLIALRFYKNAFNVDESKRVGASAELEKLAFQNSKGLKEIDEDQLKLDRENLFLRLSKDAYR